ncbi:MAG TPA: carboxypeptidase-like regulatory domain-containing protein [Planctomycetaceae bacterium]|jgi:hypothetical protein|nr:carboxypeptidase-like regulatory domain-containing protein [Planctomycetaceae bacterium]
MRLGFEAAVVFLVVANLGPALGGSDQPVAQPTGILAGRIVSLDGRPIRAGRVWIEGRKNRGKAITTAEIQSDGRFRVGPVAAECHAVLLVEASGYAREYREEVSIFPSATNEVQIVLAPGRTVSGRLLLADGRPASHQTVTAQLFRYEMGNTLNNFGPDRIAKTDEAGSFSLANVPPCELMIEARLPETALVTKETAILPGAGVQTLPALQLVPDVPISGSVCDQNGAMMPNVKVDSDFAGDRNATTDAAGRFVLRGFQADLVPFVHLRIAHPGYAYENVPVGKNGKPIQVVLKRERALSGKLVDAQTGEPVQIKSVILCTFERRANGEVVRGGCRLIRFEQPQKGHFRVPYDVPANFHITITAEGYVDAEALVDSPRAYQNVEGIVVKARRQRTDSPDVLPVQTIAGTLTRGGQPVPVAWVTLWGMYKERNTPNASVLRGRTVPAGGYISQSVVSSSGSYSVSAPHQGRWYVVVEEPNHAPTIRGLEVRLNQTLKLDIPLDDGGKISGRVRGVPTDSAGDWRVVAFDRTVWKAATRIGVDGTFCVDRLPPGEYGLKVGHDGFHDTDVPRRNSWAEKFPDDVWKTTTNAWRGATIVNLANNRQVNDVMLDLPHAAALADAPARLE